jgi:hypothetical protein
MNASDFVKLESGPYGTRWSYSYDPESDSPPSVKQAEKILGVKLAKNTVDASGERTDGLAEEVYFLAEDYSENTVTTYQVQ